MALPTPLAECFHDHTSSPVKLPPMSLVPRHVCPLQFSFEVRANPWVTTRPSTRWWQKLVASPPPPHDENSHAHVSSPAREHSMLLAPLHFCPLHFSLSLKPNWKATRRGPMFCLQKQMASPTLSGHCSPARVSFEAQCKDARLRPSP
ncbi:hypothetical protein AB1Y20_013514 [Prymnesium parvum]|uniref:Uncharacterized protein n=1 Tax=Prymnesium parvum TaxID=97485 RepID=A0AB34II15_PRYPA